METIFKMYEKATAKIKRHETAIDNINNWQNCRPCEKNAEIVKHREKLRKAIDEQLTALDSMIQMAAAIKADRNTQLRYLTLQKAG